MSDKTPNNNSEFPPGKEMPSGSNGTVNEQKPTLTGFDGEKYFDLESLREGNKIWLQEQLKEASDPVRLEELREMVKQSDQAELGEYRRQLAELITGDDDRAEGVLDYEAGQHRYNPTQFSSDRRGDLTEK